MPCFRCLSARIESSDDACSVCHSGNFQSIGSPEPHDCSCSELLSVQEPLLKRARTDGPRLKFFIHSGSCIASVPYYAEVTPVGIGDSLKELASKLPQTRHMLHPHNADPVSGLERVKLAYEAGRQAAKVLRGEDTQQGHVAYAQGRSPCYFIVLRGLKPPDQYPCSFFTFADYKHHIYEDLHIPRPTQVHPMTVSVALYSKTEACAYCMGACLPGRIIPKRTPS